VHRRYSQAICWAVVVLICAVLYPAGAQDVRQAAVDPKADEILRRMGQALAGAKHFTFEADDLSDEMLENGIKVQLAKHVKVAVRRPDKIAASVVGDEEQLRYFYSGSKVLIVNDREKCYAEQDVPNNIDEMFDLLASKFGITAPLSDLLFSDPYAAMTGGVRSGYYLGLHDVMGTKCHHLAFRQESIDWQIWIEEGGNPVPRKVVITFKDLPAYPQFAALLGKWELNAEVPDATFQFKPPGEYKRVDLVPVTQQDVPTTQPAGRGR